MKNYGEVITRKEVLSELRKGAKNVGATFKTVKVTFNNNQAYAVFSRNSGLKLSGDNTLDNWYERFCCNGFDEYKG